MERKFWLLTMNGSKCYYPSKERAEVQFKAACKRGYLTVWEGPVMIDPLSILPSF